MAQNTIGFDSSVLVTKDAKIFFLRDMAIDKNNNKYVTTNFKSNLYIDTFKLECGSTISNSPLDAPNAILLAKYNAKNELVWVKKIAEGDTLTTCFIKIDKLNEIIISFSYLAKVYLENDSLPNPNGNQNFNLIRYDTNGNLKNKITLPGAAGSDLIEFDDSNNIYVSGVFGIIGVNNYKYILGHDTLFANNPDFYIAKLDSNFNFLWTKKYGGLGHDGLAELKIYNNSLYIMGSFFNPSNINDIGGINVNFGTTYKGKGFVAKLDLEGNAKWVKKFGDQNTLSSFFASSLAVSNNRVYIAGYALANFNIQFLFEGGPTLATNYGGCDYFIAAYDTLGNFKWNTISRSIGSELLLKLEADKQGNLYGAGIADYDVMYPTDTLITKGGDDVFVFKYDSLGTLNYIIGGGGAGVDVLGDLELDNNDKPYIVGGTTSINGCYLGNDTLIPDTIGSYLFFASVDSIKKRTPTNINDPSLYNLEMLISPNPSNDYCTITLNKQEGQIQVFNLLGNSVAQYKVLGNKININTSYLANGMYWVQYNYKDIKQTKKIIIQH